MTDYISNEAALAALWATTLLMDAGPSPAHLILYGGSIPAGTAEANSNSPIATLVMAPQSFLSPTDAGPGATAAADTITADPSAITTGSPTFYRIVANGGNGAVIQQGTAGLSPSTLTLDRAQILENDTVSVGSFNINHPEF